MLIYRLWQFFLKIIVLIFHIFKNNRKILYHLWKILLNDRFQIQFLNPNPFRLLLFLILEYFTFYIYFFRELRALVVDMVLATDMSCHFQQIKAMKSLLQQSEAWVMASKLLL